MRTSSASIVTFAAGMTGFIAFMVGSGELLDLDAGRIQVFFAGISLASFLVAWLIQATSAERILERLGIPGTLLVLPIATVAAGLLLALGAVLESLVIFAIAITLWRIPRWSVDENARRAALALVPDERRTRVSFLVDFWLDVAWPCFADNTGKACDAEYFAEYKGIVHVQ